jgi:GntR family transcriptional regulator
MILLDYQDRRPIYEQVVDKFRALILSGALPPGSRMPSVRQLATELSINPNTIQRAYMELEQQGLIYPVKGKGNFIADSQDIQRITRKSYKEEFQNLVKKGMDLGMEEEEMIGMVSKCYEEGKK